MPISRIPPTAHIVILVLCLAAGAARGEESSLRILESWVGRYPRYDAGNYHPLPPDRVLWNQPTFRAALARLLGRERTDFLAGQFTTETPVERRGRWLRLYAQMPHDSTRHAEIFADPGSGEIRACWYEWHHDPLYFATGRAPRALEQETCDSMATASPPLP